MSLRTGLWTMGLSVRITTAGRVSVDLRLLGLIWKCSLSTWERDSFLMASSQQAFSATTLRSLRTTTLLGLAMSVRLYI